MFEERINFVEGGYSSCEIDHTETKLRSLIVGNLEWQGTKVSSAILLYSYLSFTFLYIAENIESLSLLIFNTLPVQTLFICMCHIFLTSVKKTVSAVHEREFRISDHSKPPFRMMHLTYSAHFYILSLIWSS